MSKRKSKLTKLLDTLERAVENRTKKEHLDPDSWEQIDEDYFMARTHLQYHVEQLEKRTRQWCERTVALEKKILETLGSSALP